MEGKSNGGLVLDGCHLSTKQKTIRWKCLKSNLQKVSQLKSIAIPWQFPWNWMVRQAKVCQVCHGKKRWVFFRHFCAADPDLKGWSANAASPARFFGGFGVSVKLGFAGKRMKWLGKRGALKWKLCKWLKTFKQLHYIIRIIILYEIQEWNGW